MATWIIRDDSREAVEDLISSSTLKKHAAIARACDMHANTIGRFLRGEPKEEATLKALFGCVLGFPAGKLPPEEQKAVNETIRAYCVKQPEDAKMKTKPGGSVATGEKNTLALLVLYSKCLHLRQETEPGKGYAYLKTIAGMTEPVPVYSEFMAVRSLRFHQVQEELDIEAYSAGIVTLLPVYPPHRKSNDNRVSGVDIFHTAKHSEAEPSQFYQPAINYINGFSLGHETVGVRLTHNADRAVLVADFSSLPSALASDLFAGEPAAFYIRENEEETETLAMDCRKTEAGAYIVDSARPGHASGTVPAWNPAQHRLLRSGKIEIQFTVNWPAVQAAYLLG